MICKICKHVYKYDYSVTDEDWEIITGIKDGSGLICLDCFDEMAYMKKYRYRITSIVYPEWFKWRSPKTEIKLPSVNTKDGAYMSECEHKNWEGGDIAMELFKEMRKMDIPLDIGEE